MVIPLRPQPRSVKPIIAQSTNVAASGSRSNKASAREGDTTRIDPRRRYLSLGYDERGGRYPEPIIKDGLQNA